MAAASGELIGIVGVGRMGLAIVKHLIAHGYRAVVCDLDAKRLEDAKAAGAQIAATAAEVGKASTFVIVAVGYDHEASAVIIEKGGLLETMGKGSIISMSATCTPDHVKMLAERAAAQGVGVLDAPICRGARAADEGTMLTLCGGTAEHFERAKPIITPFARAVNRDDIVRGAAELETPLEDVIAGVIAALKADADRLGLAGTAS